MLLQRLLGYTECIRSNKASFTAYAFRNSSAASPNLTLSCSLKSRYRSSVGKPVPILGNRKVLLARLTNRLGRRSNAVPDDFVNRFAGQTEIKVIVRSGRHGTRFPQILFDVTASRTEFRLRAVLSVDNLLSADVSRYAFLVGLDAHTMPSVRRPARCRLTARLGDEAKPSVSSRRQSRRLPTSRQLCCLMLPRSCPSIRCCGGCPPPAAA